MENGKETETEKKPGKIKRKKYNLTLDPEVVEPLHDMLRKSGITLSGYVNACLAESYEALKDLPVKVEDMTIKQFTDFMVAFQKKMKE